MFGLAKCALVRTGRGIRFFYYGTSVLKDCVISLCCEAVNDTLPEAKSVELLVVLFVWKFDGLPKPCSKGS